MTTEKILVLVIYLLSFFSLLTFSLYRRWKHFASNLKKDIKAYDKKYAELTEELRNMRIELLKIKHENTKLKQDMHTLCISRCDSKMVDIILTRWTKKL